MMDEIINIAAQSEMRFNLSGGQGIQHTGSGVISVLTDLRPWDAETVITASPVENAILMAKEL